MSLSKVDLRYRPQDLKLSVVLDDYRRAINNIVDEVNGLSEDSADTIVASSDVMNSLNPDYFIRSGKIYIKNYYDTTYPISGGGTLSSPRTLSLLYFDTDLGLDADNKLYVKDAGIDHDATTNFVVDEHIAHTGVSITAGTGLTGGGDISSTRTIGLSHLGIESLTDPGADKLMFWDDSASATKWATLGTGLAFTDVQLNVSLALNDLSDVSISLPGDSALLMYATTSGLWTAASVYAWKTIIVAGQDNVVADELADDLTLVAGANVTLTTSAAGDSVTIASAAGASAHDILSATHSDALAAAVVRGSIIYGNATPKWATLVIGAANRVLGCDGTDAAWVQADHGAALTGLGDDDHTQYLLADGTRALAGNWALGGFNLTGGGSIYSDYYILGTNPASSGRIRIPNNAIIGARNAANDANISLIYADTNNRTLIADGTFSFTSSGNAVIGASSAGSEKLDIRGRIALQETTAPSLTAGYGKLYVKSTDSLIYFLDDGGTEYNLTTGGGGAGAPSNAEYIVGATNASLSAEVVKAWLADNYSLDDYPVSPNALDDEFEDSSINVKWTFVNDPGFSESTYPGFIYYANAAELGTDNFDNLIRMYQAPPTGAATMEFIAKVAIGIGGVSAEAGEFACIGIYLGDSANDDMVGSMMQFNNASSTALPFQARGIQADAGTLANMTTDNYILASPCGFYYVKLKKTTTSAYTSANTYEAYFSQNGITWIMSATTSFTFTGLCNEVGIFFRKPKSQAGTITAEYAADFFRKTA